jgi:4-hydroxybenzoate polyprenyltransferase
MLTVVVSFVAAGFIGGVANIIAVASAVAYNFWLSRTIWSWLPYAVSFGLLPVFVAQSASLTVWPSVAVVSCSISIGVIAHVLNAIPDVDIDKQAGMGGLAVSLGRTVSWIVVIALIGVTTPIVIAVFVEFISAMT